jgi:hypothetical protein
MSHGLSGLGIGPGNRDSKLLLNMSSYEHFNIPEDVTLQIK